MLLGIAIAFDLLLAWLIRRMVRQASAYGRLPACGEVAARDWPSVAVIVPARNEADVIERCLSGLLRQNYPADRLRIWLVDDGSEDATAPLATALAGRDPRFTLIRGGELPAGWTGKCHACVQGALAAGAVDYLCFIDADTQAKPDLLRAAVSHVLAGGVAMLSLEPFQELGGLLERLVMPCGLYLAAAAQNISAFNDPDSDKAGANGQFILISRSAYRRLGGHGAVREEVSEDTALARRAKQARLRFALLGGEHLIQTRMYRDPAALWHGLTKNATVMGGGPLRTVLIAGAGFAMAVGAPLLAACAVLQFRSEPSLRHGIAALLALAGLGAGIGLHLAGTRHFRIPLVYGLLFPAGYGLALLIALESARQAWSGRVHWKGRSYAMPRMPPPPRPARETPDP